MMRLYHILSALIVGLLALACIIPITMDAAFFEVWSQTQVVIFTLLLLLVSWLFLTRALLPAYRFLLASFAAILLASSLLSLANDDMVMTTGFWLLAVAVWLSSWIGVDGLCAIHSRQTWVSALMSIFVPLLFGSWLIYFWELVVAGLNVSPVLLPAPSAIFERLINSVPILWADFVQTFVKAVLAGYVIGCLSGLIIAIIIDRSPFLQRGLMPVGNLASALPIVGVAPIMVMWFGFDWQSKAAVVVIMTFFPMLVNTIAGLAASQTIERDLMRTYAAGYWQILFKLRLPHALPFIFNALKINSTLALIGAIVAEFFGTPIVGMGFRISTEVGRLSLDMVWAEIVVAAIAGSAFYGLVVVFERVFTFWHPSYRK